MISAFGVEHGEVSKSYLNGKFVRASSLTARGRQSIRQGGHWKKAKGVDPGDAAWLKTHTAAAKEFKAMTSQGQKTGDGDAVGGATYRVGGKSSGQSLVIRSGASSPKTRKFIDRHENEHAKVKRSSYRLHRQIAGDPKKLMREEARADFRAGGHFKIQPDEGSAYAQGARASQGIRDHGPDAPFQFDRQTKAAYKNMGLKPPRITNRAAAEGVKQHLKAAMPHYDLSGSKGDEALDAYRGVHDKMRQAGSRYKRYGE